jgi:hypothetical protein
MSRIDDLKQQAARAERLARQAPDHLTNERLRQAARDYLTEAEQLAATPISPARSSTSSSTHHDS